MKEYIEMADLLEKMAHENIATLDKVAAAAFIYEASKNNYYQDPDISTLLKVASKTLSEVDLGTRMGVDMGIKAFMDSLEV